MAHLHDLCVCREIRDANGGQSFQWQLFKAMQPFSVGGGQKNLFPELLYVLIETREKSPPCIFYQKEFPHFLAKRLTFRRPLYLAHFTFTRNTTRGVPCSFAPPSFLYVHLHRAPGQRQGKGCHPSSRSVKHFIRAPEAQNKAECNQDGSSLVGGQCSPHAGSLAQSILDPGDSLSLLTMEIRLGAKGGKRSRPPSVMDRLGGNGMLERSSRFKGRSRVDGEYLLSSASLKFLTRHSASSALDASVPIPRFSFSSPARSRSLSHADWKGALALRCDSLLGSP